MIDIAYFTEEQFNRLPLVVEGESKEIRYAGKGKVVIRYKPTIYSFTSNRTGIVEGSDILRLKATKRFLEATSIGSFHSYNQINDHWVLSDLLLERASVMNPNPFRPKDMYWEDLRYAPPIEVIIKRFHSGTSKHRYFGMGGTSVRQSHPLYGGHYINSENAYPVPIVRFDWRNPFQDPNGKQLADEILPDSMADFYIDVKEARKTALRVYAELSDFLNDHDIICYDLCLFISEDGKTVYGEISQDCGRFRHYSLGSLDKDVWRAGGSSSQVLEKWQLLLELIGG